MIKQILAIGLVTTLLLLPSTLFAAASDAKPIPIKNAAFRTYFPITADDGTWVTGASSLDSECSCDAVGFSDCTSEATEISSSGWYYIDLTAAEMNCYVTIVKVTTSSAKPTGLVISTSTATGEQHPVQVMGAGAGDYSPIANDFCEEALTSHTTANSVCWKLLTMRP